ncbi:MAG: hypothetical protein ACKO6L_05930 [Flavobacteriales bacterium]
MKKQLIFLLLISPLFSLAQESDEPTHRDSILAQLQRLAGTFEGTMEFSPEDGNQTVFALPCRATTTYDKERWEYYLEYDEGAGEKFGGKGDCVVNDEATKMNYDGIIWLIEEFRVYGDTALIALEIDGKEKRKKTRMRREILITSAGFTVTEKVKYLEGELQGTFFIRNKHILKRTRRRD